MREQDLAILEDAARFENRERLLRIRLTGGEIVVVRIIDMPCKCGECTDDSVFLEQVGSSSPEKQAQWARDRIERNVGGYAIPLSMIESVEPETK